MVEFNKAFDSAQPGTPKEPDKEFGPRGTLRIPVESAEESGIYEHETLKMPISSIETPPKQHEFKHETKVIIEDDGKRMQQLRGGMVEVVPHKEQKFDLAEIETNLGRVQMAINEAQEAAGRAETPEQRGMAMKKLTELKREKEALDAQLPFAKLDEVKSVEDEYEVMVKRYQELVQKQGKTPEEDSEFKDLATKLPIAKANKDQMNQSIAFNKEKAISTGQEKQSVGKKVRSWISGLFGKK